MGPRALWHPRWRHLGNKTLRVPHTRLNSNTSHSSGHSRSVALSVVANVGSTVCTNRRDVQATCMHSCMVPNRMSCRCVNATFKWHKAHTRIAICPCDINCRHPAAKSDAPIWCQHSALGWSCPLHASRTSLWHCWCARMEECGHQNPAACPHRCPPKRQGCAAARCAAEGQSKHGTQGRPGRSWRMVCQSSCLGSPRLHPRSRAESGASRQDQRCPTGPRPTQSKCCSKTHTPTYMSSNLPRGFKHSMDTKLCW